MIPEHIQIVNADCMDIMCDIPDKHFDWAIVDPQYGISIAKVGFYGNRKGEAITNYTKKEWDNKRPEDGYWSELFRVSKNQVVFGANYFTEYLPPSKGWFFWDKNQSETNDFGKGEFVYTSLDVPAKVARISIHKYGKGNISNNIALAKQRARIHPTQKPVELYEWVYRNYVKDRNCRILDTHLGSGTHAVAASWYGVEEFIGCELDNEYYTKSLQFVSNKLQTQKLAI